MGATEWLLLIILSVLWGGSFFFNAIALDDLPPLTVVFARVARAGTTNLLLVTFLIPVSALLLAITVLGEALEARQVAGMILIALGLAAIDGRPLAACLAVVGRR